jgi:hypothetical protein
MAWSGPGGQRTLSILEFRLMVRCTEMVPVQMQERVEAIRSLKQQSEGVPGSGWEIDVPIKLRESQKPLLQCLILTIPKREENSRLLSPTNSIYQ